MRDDTNDKKVWLITGAGRGMGADIARAALAAGKAVVATGRDTDRIAAALGQSDNLLSVKLDVMSLAEAEAAGRPLSISMRSESGRHDSGQTNECWDTKRRGVSVARHGTMPQGENS
jgi:NAD(P)-dependent dehydrogenase (short-subunit alcohol dehydrogenase family)